MIAREAAVQALFARLTGAYAFSVATRRPAAPESLAAPGQPALVLVEHSETYERTANAPPKRVLSLLAIAYIDVSNDVNAIPDATLNAIQDAIDSALAPDDFASGRCTLGGLVYSAVIRGKVVRAPGDRTGKGLAVIPVEVTLP